MLENRRHTRVREDTDIRWTVEGQEARGSGKVLNSSVSGLLVRTDGNFDPRNRLLFIDAAGEKPLDSGAKKAKVVWTRRLADDGQGFECGVEFVQGPFDKLFQRRKHVPETVLNQQEHSPAAAAAGSKEGQNARLKKVIGLILCAVMLGLTIYVLSVQKQNYNLLSQTNEISSAALSDQAANYRSYVQQYKDTRSQLEETTRKLQAVRQQLDVVSAELANTRVMLSDTQAMLSQAQVENTQLKDDIQELDALRTNENVRNIPELQAKINSLKEQNSEVSTQLAGLKNELRSFQGEFANVKEGRSLIAMFQKKIKLVKTRMRYLQQEAYFAKVAAQKEKDRIQALNGNSGYLVKDGQSKRPAKSFAIDVKMVQ